MMNNPHLLRPIAVFLTVIKHGSFRRAAQDLGLSAPLVSQIIAGLEEDLGQQLIYRSTRRLTATDAGLRFADGLALHFDAIDDILTEMRSGAYRPQGRLSVTLPSVFARPAFASFISAYAQQHPDLTLHLDINDQFQSPIEMGHDLAIQITSSAQKDDTRVAKLLFHTEGIICAGPRTPAQTQGSLAQLLFVRTPQMAPTLTLRHDNTLYTLQPKREMVVNSAAMIQELLAHNDSAFALFPRFSIRDTLKSGVLQHLLPEHTLPEVAVRASYTARRARLSNARHFVAALTDYIKTLS